MLLQNKRIAVVSSNNSATANVLEKLKKYDLDFLTAFLGNKQNRTAFIEGQTEKTIQMPTLQQSKEDFVRKEIFRLNQQLDKAFEISNELSTVIQQIDALRLEFAHFENYEKETKGRNSNMSDLRLFLKISTQKLMKFWLTCERQTKGVEKTNQQSYKIGLIEKILLFGTCQ